MRFVATFPILSDLCGMAGVGRGSGETFLGRLVEREQHSGRGIHFSTIKVLPLFPGSNGSNVTQGFFFLSSQLPSNSYSNTPLKSQTEGAGPSGQVGGHLLLPSLSRCHPHPSTGLLQHLRPRGHHLAAGPSSCLAHLVLCVRSALITRSRFRLAGCVSALTVTVVGRWAFVL